LTLSAPLDAPAITAVLITTATIGLRPGVISRRPGFFGYAIALVLLLAIEIPPWAELLFPLWVLLLSAEILVESFKEKRPTVNLKN